MTQPARSLQRNEYHFGDVCRFAQPFQRSSLCGIHQELVNLFTQLSAFFPKQRGIRISRIYGVDPDVVRTVVDGHGAGQVDNASFDGAIGRCFVSTLQSPAGTGVDDAATTVLVP